MDNDCETETDVLETAKRTVLEDLEQALEMQRSDDKKENDDSSESGISDSENSENVSGVEKDQVAA